MIAGIDVGLKGAIGLLYDDGTAYVYDMPAFEKEVNAAALAGIFRRPYHSVFSQSTFAHKKITIFFCCIGGWIR